MNLLTKPTVVYLLFYSVHHFHYYLPIKSPSPLQLELFCFVLKIHGEITSVIRIRRPTSGYPDPLFEMPSFISFPWQQAIAAQYEDIHTKWTFEPNFRIKKI